LNALKHHGATISKTAEFGVRVRIEDDLVTFSPILQVSLYTKVQRSCEQSPDAQKRGVICSCVAAVMVAMNLSMTRCADQGFRLKPLKLQWQWMQGTVSRFAFKTSPAMTPLPLMRARPPKKPRFDFTGPTATQAPSDNAKPMHSRRRERTDRFSDETDQRHHPPCTGQG
jgi:hypothetical protein